ncbi:MAG: hypothetical protein GKR90_12670 [Pseudomonadales bacterium]|nr:hypothetical protein [Pseudomonadales bacterium]
MAPLFLFLAILAWAAFSFSESTLQHRFSATPHLVGTLIMLCCLPSYLVGSFVYLFRETQRMELALRDLAPPEAANQLTQSANRLSPLSIFVIILATFYGVMQNQSVLQGMMAGEPFNLLDVGVLVGNCVVWAAIGLVVSWRVPVSLAVQKYGAALTIDLYQIEKVKPITNLATKDVLIVAGAMSFMPLQSLDAEFRWVNYEAGLLVGIPTAVVLLVIPMLGVRAGIKQRKRDRIAEINQQIESTNGTDVVRLETLLSHVERIKGMSNWPIDLGIATKILGYSVIAPLAWVGAALVENLVDQIAQ